MPGARRASATRSPAPADLKPGGYGGAAYGGGVPRGRRTLADLLAAPRRCGRLPGAPALADPPTPALADYPGQSGALARMGIALVAGDDVAAAGHYLAHHATLGVDAARQLRRRDPWKQVRRIARAQAWLGRHVPEELLERAPRLGPAEVAPLTACREVGDEAAELVARTSGSGRGHPVETDARGFYALARAVLASPSRFQLAEPPPAGAPLQLKLEVTDQALLELRRRPSPAARRRVVLLHTVEPRGVALWLAVSHEGVADGVPMRVMAQVRLGETQAANELARLQTAIRAVTRRHPTLVDLTADMEDEPRAAEGDVLTTLGRGLVDGAPELALRELVGEDLCAHLEGRWRLNGGATARVDCADAAVFVCPDCHRDHLAVVPLHRLEPEHPLTHHLLDPAGADAYLRRERFHRELAGDTRPIGDLGALRRRQPALSLEDGSPLTIAPAPDTTAPGLAEVLSGRRTPAGT